MSFVAPIFPILQAVNGRSCLEDHATIANAIVGGRAFLQRHLFLHRRMARRVLIQLRVFRLVTTVRNVRVVASEIAITERVLAVHPDQCM